MKGRKRKYPLLIPRSKYWPIVQLSKHRSTFINLVVEESFKGIQNLLEESTIQQQIETTLYKEKLRMQRYRWPVDNLQNEEAFWKGVEQELLAVSKETHQKERLVKLMQNIIHHYAEEITGQFRTGHYQLGKKFAIAVCTWFLRTMHPSSLFSRRRHMLEDKINIEGELEQIRKLSQKGTVVMVPTHFSHLDSLFVGWMIEHLGLPPFIYGAGLNLFNIRLFSYFLHRLGTYKIDRRKKNLMYLETLKTYTKEIIKYGCHILFFPGGERSRSGEIETRLKFGLLSSVVSAQREMFQEKKDSQAKKIFIVPVVLSYHYVLEAPVLIREYLRRTGEARYYAESDKFSTSYRISAFLFRVLTKGSEMSMCVGRAMDILGNPVDDEGESLDKNNKRIDIERYFISQGKVQADKQREYEYTRILADKIVQAYKKYNQVLVSHLVAFVAFELIRKKHVNLDVYTLLRLSEKELLLEYQIFYEAVEKVRTQIIALEKSGNIRYEAQLLDPLERVIEQGITHCGMYHVLRPLKKNPQGDIITEDMKRLYYYHNRLKGYGLEAYI